MKYLKMFNLVQYELDKKKCLYQKKLTKAFLQLKIK